MNGLSGDVDGVAFPQEVVKRITQFGGNCGETDLLIQVRVF